LRKEADTYDPAQYEKLIESFQIMDNFLEGQDYVTGDNLTIAVMMLCYSANNYFRTSQNNKLLHIYSLM